MATAIILRPLLALSGDYVYKFPDYYNGSFVSVMTNSDVPAFQLGVDRNRRVLVHGDRPHVACSCMVIVLMSRGLFIVLFLCPNGRHHLRQRVVVSEYEWYGHDRVHDDDHTPAKDVVVIRSVGCCGVVLLFHLPRIIMMVVYIYIHVVCTIN